MKTEETLPSIHNFKNLTGQKFGKLTVQSLDGYSANSLAWKCLCECGKTTRVRGAHLKSGKIQSCSCLKKNNAVKHGQAKSPTYNVWASMLARCGNPKNAAYSRYGGRGITVCERWRDFQNFFADMGEAPSGLTLERTDNDLGYSPENCRWATRTEQARNRRSNTKLTLNGKTLTICEWEAECGISQDQISLRLRRGWSIERALTVPLRVWPAQRK
jgi:hypothetical protein